MHKRLDDLEPCLYYLNLAMYLMHGSLYPGQQTNVIHVHGCQGGRLHDPLYSGPLPDCRPTSNRGSSGVLVRLPRVVVDNNISSISYFDTQLPMSDTHLCIQPTYHTHMRCISQFNLIHYTRLYVTFKKYHRSNKTHIE